MAHTIEQSRHFYGEQTGLLRRIAVARPVWEALVQLAPIDYPSSADVVAENAMFDGLRSGLPADFLQGYNQLQQLRQTDLTAYREFLQTPDGLNAYLAGNLLHLIDYMQEQRQLLREQFALYGLDPQQHAALALVPVEAIQEVAPAVFSFAITLERSAYDSLGNLTDTAGHYDERKRMYTFIRGGAAGEEPFTDQLVVRHEDGHAATINPVYNAVDLLVIDPRIFEILAQRYRNARGARRDIRDTEARSMMELYFRTVPLSELMAEVYEKYPFMHTVPSETFALRMIERADELRRIRPNTPGLKKSVIDPALEILDIARLNDIISTAYQRLEEAGHKSDAVFNHLEDFIVALLLLPLSKMHHLESLVDMWIAEGQQQGQ